MLRPGMVVDEFEVRHLIAQGGLGMVYAARDVRLGRLVALKVIRPDRLRPGRMQRFVEEARITASFNHPNIVVVYGLGAVAGCIYIALEHLSGEALDARIARGRLGEREALRIGRDIARALSEAHRHGVIHRDVKPSNVVIPPDGRPRVVDFGLAVRTVDTGDGAVVGTPLYLAPELWRAAEAGPRSDIFSLGLVIAEMLLGHHPYDLNGQPEMRTESQRVGDALQIPETSPRVVELLRGCLAVDPERRPPLDAIQATLDELIEGPAATEAAHNEASPFRSLVSFQERDAPSFVGRDTEVGAFLELCRTRPVAAVVGPAGAGKSSFVLAGVVPRLKERGATRVFVVRPGAAPFEALAAALLVPAQAPATPAARPNRLTGGKAAVDQLAQTLESSSWELNLRLYALAASTGERVVLVVDQLEEVLTQGAPRAEASAFMEALAAAGAEVDGPVLVILTARDDFIGRVGMSPGMARVLERVLVLSPPRADQLRAILTLPLARRGYLYDDPGLVDAMMAEVQGSTAALPLLQFVCQALWERRDPVRRLLLRRAYDALGGVGGALSNYADEVLAELSSSQLHAAKQVCLRLVSRDNTRLSVPEAQLTSGLDAPSSHVVRALVAARLLTIRRDPGDEGALVELSHDSLVDTWGTLRRWRREHDNELTALRDVEDAAALWERRGEHDEDVWTGKALEGALESVPLSPIKPTPRAARFLAAGQRRDARRRRLRRVAIAALSVGVLVLSSVGFALAVWFRTQAERIDLARADIGRFTLHLAPFDWDPVRLAAVPASCPDLALRLHTTQAGPLGVEPGPEVEASLVTIETVSTEPLVMRVATRGGRAVLAIHGRGGDCGPSWIEVAALPGYAERDRHAFVIPVPTCQASRAGQVAIPAGAFVSGGPGEPSIAQADGRPEQERQLPAFRIDRTELPNGLAEPFFALATLTGITRTELPVSPVFADAGRPDRPVTSLDAFQARALCRYLGRRLPTSPEWEKAARGGLTLDGAPNPHPRRNLPWGPERAAERANLQGAADGVAGLAPVDAFPEGASPYGVLNLVGNVHEWTASSTETDRPHHLRVIRGGDWDSDGAASFHFTAYENQRVPRFFNFGLGVRCAGDE